jgi:hypothetical protein
LFINLYTPEHEYKLLTKKETDVLVKENAISESLCDEIYSWALRNVLGHNQTEPVVFWTNLAWERNIVRDSTPVICMKLSNSLRDRVQKELQDLGIIDLEKHLTFEENNNSGCMAYVWTHNSYIAEHSDSHAAKTLTLYLNREWSFGEGGNFNWYDKDSKEWKVIVPKFNTLVENFGGILHSTTPVKSTQQLRVTLQMFIIDKEKEDI